LKEEEEHSQDLSVFLRTIDFSKSFIELIYWHAIFQMTSFWKK